MRSAVISVSSPKEDIVGVLTGVWGTFRRGVNKEWLVTKTPFMVSLCADLKKGGHELPMKFNRNTILTWVNRDSSGSLLIGAQETHFELDRPSHVELTYMGGPDGATDV